MKIFRSARFLLFSAVIWAISAHLEIISADAVSPVDRDMDFSAFKEDDWLAVVDPAVGVLGRFIQKDGFIQNYVKDEHRGSRSLDAGHALRLLKDCQFGDGRIEAELMLVGKAAPSIYFRTRVENGVHKETYNLVVFDFSGPDNAAYHGFNLWKWKDDWAPSAKPWKNWVLIASWAFPVPSEERIKMAVETEGPRIKVYYNGVLKGSILDPDPILSGYVGICSCEGVNNFYRFKVKGTGGSEKGR